MTNDQCVVCKRVKGMKDRNSMLDDKCESNENEGEIKMMGCIRDLIEFVNR